MRRKMLLSLLVVPALMGVLLAAAPPETASERSAAIAPSDDPISAFADRVRVGPPERYRNLVLYPIYADAPKVPAVDLTLDEAMARGVLEITEVDRAQVNRVRVRNLGKDPVFIMGGEMISGAKQDRIAGDDVIVPAGGKLVIPVFCVEHGRWVAQTDTFKSASFMAGSAVRQARAAADQSAVWESVAGEQERLSAPSATGSLRSVQESEEVQEKVKPYQRAFVDLPEKHPRARGVVACAGGRIIAADLFGSRVLFQDLWPKLLDSYVIDALDREEERRGVDAVHIKRWLDGVKRASRTPKDTPGSGSLYELRGGGVLGSALVYQGGIVHMELFRALSVPEPIYGRLEFRRERLQGEEAPELEVE